MKLNRGTIKTIIYIILGSIVFAVGLINLSSVWKEFMTVIGILTPIILGLCIAFLLEPMVSFAETKVFGSLVKRFPVKGRGLSRGLGLLTSFIVVAGIIAILILLVVPEVKDAFDIIGETLPSAISDVVDQINTILVKFEFDTLIPTGGSEEWMKLFAKVRSYVETALEKGFLSDIANTAKSVVGGITDFVLGLILSVYILAKKDEIAKFLKDAAKAYLKPRTKKRLFKIISLTNISFRNFVSGQLTEALIIGALCFIGMTIFRFPYPTAASAVVGVSALVPIFGAWIGGILGALLAFSESFTKALLFIVFLVILQQLEGNLIYPRVVGKSVGLPGILVFLSVMMGAGIAGVLGMILAVPLCSIFYTLLKESIEKRLKKAGSYKDIQTEGKQGEPPDYQRS
jgi:predicted PurR-regulated permease PerM